MSLKNPVTQPRIDPGTVRLVAQRLNHYATPGPNYSSSSRIKNDSEMKDKNGIKSWVCGGGVVVSDWVYS